MKQDITNPNKWYAEEGMVLQNIEQPHFYGNSIILGERVDEKGNKTLDKIENWQEVSEDSVSNDNTNNTKGEE